MSFLHRIRFRRHAFFEKEKLEAELDEELAFHLEKETRELIAKGVDSEEARRAARRRLGGVEQIKEACRDAWGTRLLENLLEDIRYGFRMLRKGPGLTLLAILTLSLGIGVFATLFSVFDNYLLEGLPFPEAERIFAIQRLNRNKEQNLLEMPVRDFSHYRKAQTAFEEMAAYRDRTVSFRAEGLPQRFLSANISANFLKLLRTGPILGRGFREEEDEPGAAKVVLISYALWQSVFNGDADTLGKTIHVDGKPATVVGVLPPDFRFPRKNDLWLPLQMDPAEVQYGTGKWVVAFGRLKAGMSPNRARSELTGIARRLEVDYPDRNTGYNAVRVRPYIKAYLGEETVSQVWICLIGACLVFFVSCANVANLLLARFSHRGRELAIRSAMGATRFRIVGQMLTESLVLSFFGAVGGIFLSLWGMKLLWIYISRFAPFYVNPFDFDFSVLLFVVGVMVLTGFLSGLIPALRASRPQVVEMLKDETRTETGFKAGRFSRMLVSLQVAFSCVLLVGAGLMIKMVFVNQSLSLPFNPSSIVMGRLVLRGEHYKENSVLYQFYSRLVEKLRQKPGVEAVGVSDRHLLNEGRRTALQIDGAVYRGEKDYPSTFYNMISNGFFNTLGVSLREGRPFAETDTAASLPVAVVNTPFAAKFWPRQSPLGKRFREAGKDKPWLTVVGVAPDLQMEGVIQRDGSGFYRPMSQKIDDTMTILMRGRGGARILTEALRQVVFEMDPELALKELGTVREEVDGDLYFSRVLTGVFSVFGGVAVLLAAVGVYGVVAFSVSRRTREIGIRLALGARNWDIIRLIFRQGVYQIVLGLVAGLGIAFWLGHFLIRIFLLWNVSPNDPAIFLFVVILLSGVGMTCVFIPALRASRIDPVIALRHE